MKPKIKSAFDSVFSWVPVDVMVDCVDLKIEIERLENIESAAKKFVKGNDVSYADDHKDVCGIIPRLRFDGGAIDDDCTCGLIELVKALENE
jgi:hypothetical protein